MKKLISLLLLAGCGEPSLGTGSRSITSGPTVFLILMENKNWDDIAGNSSAPYINNVLLPVSSYATNYHGANNGNAHPSEPNYIWLEAGDTRLPNGSRTVNFNSDNDPSASNRSTTTQHL